MKLKCTVTGRQFVMSPSLPITLTAPHPLMQCELGDLRRLVDSRWDTYSEADKQMLWVAIAMQNPLLTIRTTLTPNAALVESSIERLASLTVWVATRANAVETIPQLVISDHQCSNLHNWLKLVSGLRQDRIAKLAAFDMKLTEQEESQKFDKILSRWNSARGVTSDDLLPAKLANWVLVASEAPIVCYDEWFAILTKPKENLLTRKDFKLADAEELLEHLEDWKHNAVLRVGACRQLRLKIGFLRSGLLDGEANLDWLLDANASIAASATKTATQLETTFEIVGNAAMHPKDSQSSNTDYATTAQVAQQFDKPAEDAKTAALNAARDRMKEIAAKRLVLIQTAQLNARLAGSKEGVANECT